VCSLPADGIITILAMLHLTLIEFVVVLGVQVESVWRIAVGTGSEELVSLPVIFPMIEMHWLS